MTPTSSVPERRQLVSVRSRHRIVTAEAAEKLAVRLVRPLLRYRERCKPDGLSELARQHREFAEALE